MKITLSLIGVVALIMLVMAGTIGFLYANLDKQEMFSGVQVGSEYKYVQYTGAIATSSLIQTGNTTLGSVIITEDQAGAVVLYDATSTAAVDEGNTALFTRVADFQNASAEGVYEFNAYLSKGLVFYSDDGFLFAGDWTITYR